MSKPRVEGFQGVTTGRVSYSIRVRSGLARITLEVKPTEEGFKFKPVWTTLIKDKVYDNVGLIFSDELETMKTELLNAKEQIDVMLNAVEEKIRTKLST